MTNPDHKQQNPESGADNIDTTQKGEFGFTIHGSDGSKVVYEVSRRKLVNKALATELFVSPEVARARRDAIAEASGQLACDEASIDTEETMPTAKREHAGQLFEPGDVFGSALDGDYMRGDDPVL